MSDFSLSDVCRVHVVGLSREQRPRKTKIGTEVAHVTCDSDTTFKVKRLKVKVTVGGAYCSGLPHSLFRPNLSSSFRLLGEISNRLPTVASLPFGSAVPRLIKE